MSCIARSHHYLTLLMCTACAPDSASIVPFAVRDSAGVEIVESGIAVWADDEGWTVDTVPVVAIGQEEGEDPYLLARVVDAFRRDDGAIVVVEGASRQLRLFDSAGRFVRAVGRAGQGPGEFRRIEYASRCGGDALWITADKRLLVWDLDLTYRREFTFTDNLMWPLICFGGTGLLVKEDVRRGGEDPVNEIYLDSLHLRTLDSVGGARRDLLTIPLWAYINISEGRGGFGFPHPFGAQTVLAQHGTQVIIGLADKLELRSYRREGGLVRITRGPTEDMTITPALVKAYTASHSLIGVDREVRDKLVAGGTPMPRAHPAFDALEVDHEGNAWVRRFVVPGTPATRWGVFRQDGRFLGHVKLPAGVQVLEIGADYVLGLGKGPMDEEQVRLYRLKK